MKEVKIEVPEGHEIDKENSTFERIVFKEIKKELPKSWEELDEINGYYVTTESCIESVSGGVTNEDNKNIFKTNKQAISACAKAQLSQLMDIYNEGWKPDWENKEAKYIIYRFKNKIDLNFVYFSYNFLAFKTLEIRDKFYRNFEYLIGQYLMLE